MISRLKAESLPVFHINWCCLDQDTTPEKQKTVKQRNIDWRSGISLGRVLSSGATAEKSRDPEILRLTKEEG